MNRCLLGVNCDHIATLREARGGIHPDPLRAVALLQEAGADGITLHLREDRRHIQDEDAQKFCAQDILPVNLEMAATDEMEIIACSLAPAFCCLVPEAREELTTEGGLDVVALSADGMLQDRIKKLQERDIRVSLFIEADLAQLEAAHRAGADAIEIHTGTWVRSVESVGGANSQIQWDKIKDIAERAAAVGLLCHAGHGLTYDHIADILELPTVGELNIGHFLMGEALFVGLVAAVGKMRCLMDEARS